MKKTKKRGQKSSSHGNETFQSNFKHKKEGHDEKYLHKIGTRMDEITNDIQKSGSRCFGHLMQMTEERMPKKIFTQKWRVND